MLGKANQNSEVVRRVQLGWAVWDTFLRTMLCLKRKIYGSFVLPIITYGMETITLTVNSERKMNTTKRSVERGILGMSLRDRSFRCHRTENGVFVRN